MFLEYQRNVAVFEPLRNLTSLPLAALNLVLNTPALPLAVRSGQWAPKEATRQNGVRSPEASGGTCPHRSCDPG